MDIVSRVKNQYVTSYMTFLSILVGFSFEDIVTILREDDRFFSYDLIAINMWSQVIVCVGAAITAWVAYGQVAMARRTVPSTIDSINIVWFCFLLYLLNSLIGTTSDYLWFLACASWAYFGALATYIVTQFLSPDEGQLKGYSNRVAYWNGPITLAVFFATCTLLEAYFFWAWSDSVLLGTIANFVTLAGMSTYLMYMTWVWKNYLLYPGSKDQESA
jgi:hypothetical protein